MEEDELRVYPDWKGFYILGKRWQTDGCPPSNEEVETAFKDIASEFFDQKMDLTSINSFYGPRSDYENREQRSRLYHLEGTTIDLTFSDFQRTATFDGRKPSSWIELFFYGRESHSINALIRIMERDLGSKYEFVPFVETGILRGR